jgi:type III secretion system (T3SS) inner membrane Yop/YscD-like protein
MQGEMPAGPAHEALAHGSAGSATSEHQMLNLRVVKGLHRGALTPIAPSEVILVGADEDCDVILHDAGVARHHCVLSNMDSKLFLRAIDGPLVLDGRVLDPGRSICVKPGSCVELGSTAFDVVSERDSDVPYVERLAQPRGTRGRLMLWNMRWAAVAVLAVGVAVACGLNPVQIGLRGRSPQAAQAPAEELAAGRPGGDIARDVKEVLRLSDVACDAHYDGNGTVTVHGHMGDPKVLATVIQSRAMREIVGLKRVLAVNLDDPHGTASPTQVDGTRIVSAISGDDPYVVTADGSRYYVGAELPQGGRLAGVEGDEVLIERNGQVEHWRLPGARLGSSNQQEKRT